MLSHHTKGVVLWQTAGCVLSLSIYIRQLLGTVHASRLLPVNSSGQHRIFLCQPGAYPNSAYEL